MNEKKQEMDVNTWGAAMQARIDALPRYSADRKRMLIEEGIVYEFFRNAAVTVGAIDDDLFAQIEDELVHQRSALQAIVTVLVERQEGPLFSAFESMVMDLENWAKWDQEATRKTS